MTRQPLEIAKEQLDAVILTAADAGLLRFVYFLAEQRRTEHGHGSAAGVGKTRRIRRWADRRELLVIPTGEREGWGHAASADDLLSGYTA